MLLRFIELLVVVVVVELVVIVAVESFDRLHVGVVMMRVAASTSCCVLDVV